MHESSILLVVLLGTRVASEASKACTRVIKKKKKKRSMEYGGS